MHEYLHVTQLLVSRPSSSICICRPLTNDLGSMVLFYGVMASRTPHPSPPLRQGDGRESHQSAVPIPILRFRTLALRSGARRGLL